MAVDPTYEGIFCLLNDRSRPTVPECPPRSRLLCFPLPFSCLQVHLAAVGGRLDSSSRDESILEELYVSGPPWIVGWRRVVREIRLRPVGLRQGHGGLPGGHGGTGRVVWARVEAADAP